MLRPALLALLLLAPVAAAQAPTCQRVEPGQALAANLWDTVTFKVHCDAAPGGSLGRVEWTLDQGQYLNRTSGNGTSSDFEAGVTFRAVGEHTIYAVAWDAAGREAPAVAWSVQVTDPAPGSGGAQDPSAQPRTASSWWAGVDPVAALGAVTTAIVGVGGLVLGFVKLRRRGGSGDGEDSSAAPPAGGVAQTVGSNSGTMVGSAGTVIVNAPPAPAPGGVPPGVPARKRALYLALEEARDVLDAPEAGVDVINARDLVQELMDMLRSGEAPLAASRRAAAEAVQRAVVRTGSERVTEGAAALDRAVQELLR